MFFLQLAVCQLFITPPRISYLSIQVALRDKLLYGALHRAGAFCVCKIILKF